MPLSRPFRALVRLTVLWALPWTVGGLAVGTLRWILSPDLRQGSTTLAAWLVNHAVTYGSLGLISGFYLGLLLAQVAKGATWSRLSRRSVALWGAVAGAAPIALFAGLGLIFGAPGPSLLALVGLGGLSSIGSAVLATSTHAATTGRTLGPSEERLLP